MSSNKFIHRINCPVCSAVSYDEIYRQSYGSLELRSYLLDFYRGLESSDILCIADSDYIVCLCRICDAIFQKNIPNAEFMAELYEVWIDSKNEMARKASLPIGYYLGHVREMVLILQLFDKLSSSLRFLDFGMGWGAWALAAKALGVDSYGTEISEERIRYAQQGGVKAISWEDIPQQEFDFINAEQVFEHITSPLDTLRHLKAGLRPGGIIKISVPYSPVINQSLRLMDWKRKKGSFFSINPVAPLEHINYFRRSSIVKMGNECGLNEIRIPLVVQYRLQTIFLEGSIASVLKNIIRPVYNRLGNYVFLQKGP
jgi:2-polyprenyl-3-methyl-5-hydroxy-6-metoxy-1,4-benzoquinol methylase